jgi:hypothetical protein
MSDFNNPNSGSASAPTFDQVFNALQSGETFTPELAHAAAHLLGVGHRQLEEYQVRTAKLTEELQAAQFAAQTSQIRLTDDEDSETDALLRTLDDDNMVLDKSTPRAIAVPRNKNTSILEVTKGMRTHSSNIISKLGRLRARLVKLGACDTLPKKKAFYQLRYTSPSGGDFTIFKSSKDQIDNAVADDIVRGLIQDANAQITALKEELEGLNVKLTNEINELKEKEISHPDLSDGEKLSLETRWKTQLDYNLSWFHNELIKLKTNTPNNKKVCRTSSDVSFFNSLLRDLILNSHIFFINNVLETTTEGTEQAPGTTGSTSGTTQPPQKATTTTTTWRNLEEVKESEQGETEGQQTSTSRKPSKKRRSQNKRSRRLAAKNWQKLQQGHEAEQQQEQFQESPTGERRKSEQKVFVNVASQQNISIPSYVYSTLNLGANYQLINFPSQRTIREGWSETRQKINKLIKSSDFFSDNRSLGNMLDAVQTVCINDNYFNKVIVNKKFRKVVNHNKLVQKCFNFLNANSLMCILADKNLGLTVIDKSWYIENMLKHFERNEVFDRVDVGSGGLAQWVQGLHPQLMLQSRLREVLNQSQYLTNLKYVFDPRAVTLPQAYGLIKLHKTPYKLRIITPVVNWVNVLAAQSVSRFLTDYVKKCKHVLESSKDLINILEGSMGYDITLASYDVSDMYNSIRQDLCLARIQYFAESKGWWTGSTNKKWERCFALILFVFETSFVGFGGQVYKQKTGLPMGSPLSPVLANLYMAALEESMLNNESYTDIKYFRYLDDLLLVHINQVSVNNELDHNTIVEKMNYMALVKLFRKSENTIVCERTHLAHTVGQYVEYLDLKIWINHNNNQFRRASIGMSLYDKPSNLHIYTDPSTFYPFHYVYNWIQGENIRLIRNSSRREDYNDSLKDFTIFLSRRGYSEKLVSKFIAKNYFEDRAALLRGEKPHKLREGLDNKDLNNRQLMVQNSGIRPLMTNVINIVDNISASLQLVDFRIQPVVTRGKSVISVFDQAKKNLL